MNTQKRVLLVDDESSIRRTLSLGLAQRGYDTEPCENGVNALMKMDLLVKNNSTPDAVVLDIQLPDIMGTKLARIINFKYPNVPVFLITGYADKLNEGEISELKVQALLHKPLTSDELADQFETIMKEQLAAPVAPVEPVREALALLHIEANLTTGGIVVTERFIRGAPFLAPLLFSNMGVLGLIVLLDPTEMATEGAMQVAI